MQLNWKKVIESKKYVGNISVSGKCLGKGSAHALIFEKLKFLDVAYGETW